MIDSLKPNEVFVYGSNLLGQHVGGAAKQAFEQFGAKWGVGVGLAGQSYAIPTMEGLELLELYADQFLEFAATHQKLTFLLTPIGQGIAGYTKEQIEPFLAKLPPNVQKVGW